MSPNINFDPSIDYYKALGVSDDAAPDDIKRAYRKLAKKFHPDATGGDKSKEKRFKEVTTAYEVLGDQDKRAQYDALRRGGFNPFAGAPGAAGGPGFDFGDLFSQFFGGGQGRGGRPGGGASYRVYTGGGSGGADIPFESFFGGHGPGVDPTGGAGPQPRGRARARSATPREIKVRASDGSTLTQRGHDLYSDVRLGLDEATLGTTKSVATQSGRATVKIPPGTSSGVKLRLKGKGVAKSNGGHGDHFVTVQIDVPQKLDEDAKRALIEFMRKVRK